MNDKLNFKKLDYKTTDAEGNEKDTFVVGEPIYVTATATSSSVPS